MKHVTCTSFSSHDLHFFLRIVCQDLSLSDSENSTFLKCPIGLRDSKEGEQARRLHQKSDFVKVLDSMRIPLGRFYVPLCRMIPLPKVRPIQEVDVATLEKRFEGGYIDGDRAMYISIFDDHLSSMNVTEEHIASWDPHWRDVNERFENQLQSNPDYVAFRGKMFFVWDGNHRFTAWWRHINAQHVDDLLWHYSVFCIVLDPKGRITLLLNCMHDVNW